MADESVKVSISADTSQMRQEIAAGAASAKASFDGVEVSAAQFQAALKAAGGDATAALRAVAQGAQQTGAQTEAAMKKGGAATAGMTREFIVLGHEVVSGNFSRIPGSLMVLAERSGGLRERYMQMASAVGLSGGQFALALAGAVALGAGVAALISKIIEMHHAVMEIGGAMAQMGHGGEFSFKGVKDQVVALARGYDISRESAGNVLATFQRLPGATAEQRNKLADLTLAYIQAGHNGTASSEQIEKGTEEVAGAAAGGAASVERFLTAHNMLSKSYIEELERAKEFNDVIAAQKILADALGKSFGDYGSKLKGANAQGSVTVSPITGRAQYNAKPTATSLTGAGNDQSAIMDQTSNNKIPQQMQEMIAGITATWTGGKAQLDALVAQMYHNILDQTHTSGKTLQALTEASLQADKQARESAAADAVSGERLKWSKVTAAGSEGREKDLQNQIKETQAEIAAYAQFPDKAREAQIKLNQLTGQLADERARKALEAVEKELDAWSRADEEKARVAKLAVDGQNQYDEIELRAVRESLDEQVSAGKITADERLMIERNLTTQIAQQQMQRLADELATQFEGTAAYQETQNKIMKLAAETGVELNKIDAQTAANQRKSLDQQAQQYERLFQPIGRAFDGMVSGILQGTQTVRQAFSKMGTDIALSFTESIAKMMLKEAAYQLFMELGWSKMALSAATSEAEKAAAAKAAAAEIIPAETATAAMGAASAVAGIPIVGPELAAGAAAAMNALGLASLAEASAAGGYDIPSGVNPVVQTHAREMILPAHLSDGIRNMISGNSTAGTGTGNGGTQSSVSPTGSGSGAGAVHVHLNVSAVDGASVARLFNTNGGALSDALVSQVRNLNSSLISSLKAATA